MVNKQLLFPTSRSQRGGKGANDNFQWTVGHAGDVLDAERKKHGLCTKQGMQRSWKG